jgi:hypothetical protein
MREILRGGSTAGLKALAAACMKAVREFDTCTRNHFRGNQEALGAWAIARHVQRSPRREEDSAESPSGSSTGGGSNTPITAITRHGRRFACWGRRSPRSISNCVPFGAGSPPD